MIFQLRGGLSHLPRGKSGAIYRIIVGTHLLVSTPSSILKPTEARLGIDPRFARFPRIHPILTSTLLSSGPKIQSCALPLSYPGILLNCLPNPKSHPFIFLFRLASPILIFKVPYGNLFIGLLCWLLLLI